MVDAPDKAIDYFGLLDQIMVAIPGLDNGGNRKDRAFDRPTFRFNNEDQDLNACRYHRLVI